MKHEETRDITTLLVEPTDERSSVVRQVGRVSHQRKPVVVVLPENAAIRRPGDLLELKRVTSQWAAPMTLVILDNQRLRTWAHRQGFTVFSSTETCARALVRQRNTQPLHKTGTPGSALALSTSPRDTEPLASRQLFPLLIGTRWQETLLLVLLTLLILGILGGIGFGYLLSIAHTAPRLGSLTSYVDMIACV